MLRFYINLNCILKMSQTLIYIIENDYFQLSDIYNRNFSNEDIFE